MQINGIDVSKQCRGWARRGGPTRARKALVDMGRHVSRCPRTAVGDTDIRHRLPQRDRPNSVSWGIVVMALNASGAQ